MDNLITLDSLEQKAWDQCGDVLIAKKTKSESTEIIKGSIKYLQTKRDFKAAIICFAELYEWDKKELIELFVWHALTMVEAWKSLSSGYILETASDESNLALYMDKWCGYEINLRRKKMVIDDSVN